MASAKDISGKPNTTIPDGCKTLLAAAAANGGKIFFEVGEYHGEWRWNMSSMIRKLCYPRLGVGILVHAHQCGPAGRHYLTHCSFA